MRLIELHCGGRRYSLNADFITGVAFLDECGCHVWLLGEPIGDPNFCDESYEEVIQLIKEATNEGVPIKKCSAKAFAMCPDNAVCEKFNEFVDAPVTNADRIRAMRDEELSEFLCSILSEDRDGCSGCVAEDYCYQGHTGMIDYLREEYNGKTDI